MNSSLVEDLIWYRAATLTERLAAGHLCHATEPPTEDDLARYRWQSWKAQPPFDEDAALAQRLALDGLTESQLRHLVAEPLEALRARFSEPPAWMHDLRAALTQPFTSDFRLLLADKLQSKPALGFLNAAAPFIEYALARFDQGIATLIANTAALPFDPATIKQLCFANLPKDLLEILNRTMALELNIARLSGELEGDTSEARFQSFIERLRQPERVCALLREYPVLARLLSEQAQRWVEISLEFLTRLCRDWEEIKATFSPGVEPGVLIKVKGGLADTQRGGRAIFIVQFSSGFQLVYKPRPLAVDVHFQELLQWLNERGADPRFPLLGVLHREKYGWIEFVQAHECETVEEVRRFYRRQGGYLALLYLIEATDFHSANLIACGEHPYLIDLEALFHPHRSRTTDDATDPADKLAERTMGHSVLRIGLLPKQSWGNSEQAGIDRSGLGTIDGQLTPHELPRWEGKGTDTMHLVRARKPVMAHKNRPRLVGGTVNVLDYQDEILAGFASTYSLLLAHRDELLADDGPLTRFAEDEVCVFLRSMRTYRRLLDESYHPDVLRDALDRDRLFDALWAEVADDPALVGVIRTERDAMQCGDTPLFTTHPHSPDLLPYGSERIPDFFAEASLTTVRRRIAQLSLADCERQAWFIRASLATIPTAEPQLQTAHPTASELSRESLLAAAQTMGNRLEALAIRGADDASWLGLMQEREHYWFIGSLTLDLDGGLPGVALFLAYLGKLTGQERYTTLAQAALTTMQRMIAKWGDEVTLIGAFDGWGGVIYTLTQLGVLWERPDLIAEAEATVARLPELIAEDTVLNVYGGAAGCIAGLRCLAQVAPSAQVTAAAIQCGDHLLLKGGAAKQGRGFARGTTGIAWALRTLHDWTGLERFRVTEGGEWEAHVRAQAASMLAFDTAHGWRCGTPLAVETPGLLSGLAGIGYELLRLVEPELVPSVLALKPPTRRQENDIPTSVPTGQNAIAQGKGKAAMFDPTSDRVHPQRSPQETAWDLFLETLPDGDFMQTSWWAKFMEELDWGYFGVIVNHGEIILGGARVLRNFYRPGYCYYYIPEGPALPAYPEVGVQVFQYLMNYIENMRQQEETTVSHLRIEPRWSVLPDYIIGFQAATDWMEPRHTRCLDLTQSEDTLLAQMKPKGRYNIGLAKRHGVKVVEDVSPQGRADFIRLYHETVTRQNIEAKSQDYFDSLLTMLAELKQGTIFFAEYAGVRLAAALIVCFGGRVTYFFGGSTEQHRQVMAPYLLHYEIMLWAKARRYKSYDLYGISPPDESDHRWAGFSSFKRKLGGQDFHFVPALDYIYDAEAYAEFKRTL